MNPIQYCPGFLFTIFLGQPFMWGFVVLGIVAAVNAVTKRYDISGDSAGAIWIIKRYPMIHSQRMPKPSGTAAHSTATVEIVERELPIVLGKVIGKTSFSCHVPIQDGLEFIPVVFGVLASILFLFFWVFLFPIPSSLGMVRVVPFYGAFSLPLFFNVAVTPFPAASPALFFVIGSPLAFIFASFVWITCQLYLLAMAQLTVWAKANRRIAVLSIEIFSGCWEFVAALGTALKGCVIIALHVEPPFDVPCPGLLKQRRDNVFTPLIIPQTEVIR